MDFFAGGLNFHSVNADDFIESDTTYGGFCRKYLAEGERNDAQ